MSKLLYTLALLLLVPSICIAQNTNLDYLVDVYKSADRDCYTSLIQKSLDLHYQQRAIDLEKERKLFILSVYVDWDRYFIGKEDIYDCISIDSLRTFIVAVIDKSNHIKGITDIEEVGSYTKTKKTIKPHCLWMDLDVIQSRKGRDALIEAYKLFPLLKQADAIMYCINNHAVSNGVPCTLLFVLQGKIYLLDFFCNTLTEYQQAIQEVKDQWADLGDEGEANMLSLFMEGRASDPIIINDDKLRPKRNKNIHIGSPRLCK